MAPLNGPYVADQLAHVSFPLGGLGAGMIGLEGTGGFADLSLRHAPEVWTKPLLFGALCVRGVADGARVLEGPVPPWRIFGPSATRGWGSDQTGHGAAGAHYGLPRFAEAAFQADFPFATVALRDPALPITATLTAWSPFVPGDADASSLPVAALEYAFTNTSDAAREVVFSFHATNVMRAGAGGHGVGAVPHGIVLRQDGTPEEPWRAGALCLAADDPAAVTDACWFRGGWFDALTMLWGHIAAGDVVAQAPVTEGEPSPGGSLYVPCTLAPGETRTVRVRLSWYVPVSRLRAGKDPAGAAPADAPTYRPWYAARFPSVEAVDACWAAEVEGLRARSAAFRDALAATTLPAEVRDAVAANLAILKSPTVLRQEDGRLWCWEGACESAGCCHGSCTHVWNYAQAIAHLFPALERTLRETEFLVCQDERGHQTFRAPLPIRPPAHDFHAAADGQLGGIMKVYRDWRISGDTGWLRGLWPRVRQSLHYCIETWDPARSGALAEPHHNTYDIEFWGPDGMCTSFYLGALVAAARMAEALGEDAAPFDALAARARQRLEGDLYNGEYFIQHIQWEGLRAGNPVEAAQHSMVGAYSPEAHALLEREGPKYQYGAGCLSDGVLGAWMAEVCGVGEVLDAAQVASHLRAVHRHNLRRDLSRHANPQRPSFALGREGGLLLCTWPRGEQPSLPFVYSNEVWTGIEYQVAAHLILHGAPEEGLEIVRLARARYDGRVRNPFDEYECGHWYGRALASYALLAACSGARYDAVERTLYLAPRLAGDFQSFFAAAGGYGLVGVRDGQPFLEVRAGEIPVERIAYTPYA